jgi:hypothetical protein
VAARERMLDLVRADESGAAQYQEVERLGLAFRSSKGSHAARAESECGERALQ